MQSLAKVVGQYSQIKRSTWLQFEIIISQLPLTLCSIISSLGVDIHFTVLVTGGVGFIGFHSALKLQEEHHVIVLDDFSSEYGDVMKLRAKHLTDRSNYMIWFTNMTLQFNSYTTTTTGYTAITTWQF